MLTFASPARLVSIDPLARYFSSGASLAAKSLRYVRPFGDDHGGAAWSRTDCEGVPVVRLQNRKNGLRLRDYLRQRLEVSSTFGNLVAGP